jgi:UDPglucose--hexose-1-phosphate uridylyltransferase
MAEIRRHPLLQVPVFFAPERAARPTTRIGGESPSAFPEECPFCPGNESETPPEIAALPLESAWDLRLFPNKHPIVSVPDAGLHEVLVDARDHIEQLPVRNLEKMVEIYRDRWIHFRDRGLHPVIFKNRGRLGGESIAHPHSQLLGVREQPSRFRTELQSIEKSSRCMVCEDSADPDLTILEGNGYRLFAPSVPRFAGEVWIAPVRHTGSLETIDAAAVAALLSRLFALRALEKNYDFNWGVMASPEGDEYHWYLEWLPRHSPGAGFETETGSWVNTELPETTVARLRTTLARETGRT